jgi:hypothetical protein
MSFPGISLYFFNSVPNFEMQTALARVPISHSFPCDCSLKTCFVQEELGKFIKFASNQDRIPMVGDREWQHVPPYPMKIAPSDRNGKYFMFFHQYIWT